MPFISVLVTAYNRDLYVLDALKSVVNQTLPSDSYEIILVHNSSNQAIEEYCSVNNIISVTPDSQLVGNWICEGLKLSKGDIISFLDDDDVFLPHKLEIVNSVFSRYKDLIYFHSNVVEFVAVDERSAYHPEGDELCVSLVETSKCNIGIIASLVRNSYCLNMSSIVVRKDVLLKYESLLSNLSAGPDFFAFYATLTIAGSIAWLNKPLSLYRIHDSTTHYLSSDFEDYVGKKVSYAEKFLDAIELYLEVASHGGSSLFNYIKFQRAAWICMKDNFSGSRHLPRRLKDIIASLFYGIMKVDSTIIYNAIISCLSFSPRIRISLLKSFFYAYRDK